MSTCSGNKYFSSFLDACVNCPDFLKDCNNEGPDLLSCHNSCGASLPVLAKNDPANNHVSNHSSSPLVIGIAVACGLVALFALLGMAWYLCTKPRRNRVQRNVEENREPAVDNLVDPESGNSESESAETTFTYETDEELGTGYEEALSLRSAIPKCINKSRESL